MIGSEVECGLPARLEPPCSAVFAPWRAGQGVRRHLPGGHAVTGDEGWI